jgi:hypothetical protein
MIKALMSYYDRVGISALGFNCKHLKECMSVCQNKKKFTTAREPYIGEYYSKRGLPKLLFLSLDSGDENKDPKTKTIQAMREGNLHLSLQEFRKKKQRHWYKTHQFAWIIFDEVNRLSKSTIDIGKTNSKLFFEPESEIYKIMPYFAHTNSAKCCMNIDHAKQANRMLFDNCREYIAGEIKILDPHILVTQGNYAKIAIENAIKKKLLVLKEKRNVPITNQKKPDLSIIEVNNKRPALWIHHYHPSNYGVFNTKVYPNYRNYAKAAARFIADNYPELLHSRQQ